MRLFGLFLFTMACTDPNPEASDAAQIDAVFSCNDDSSFEPNQELTDAVATAIGPAATTTQFNDMAICPLGDSDLYQTQLLEAATILTATLDTEGNGVVEILDETGSVLAPSTQIADDTYQTSVEVPASGRYFVRVSGADDRLNYDLRLTIM